MRKTYMMLLALVLTMLGVSDAMAQKIYRAELDKSMFKAWTSDQPGATEDTDPAPEPKSNNPFACESNLYKEVAAYGTIFGSSNVYCLWYADLTGTQKMIVTGTPGMSIRLMLNRVPFVEGGTGDADGGAYVELIKKIEENGTVEFDLSSYEYVHLNAIKVPGGGTGGVVKNIELVGTVKPVTGILSMINNGDAEGEDLSSFPVSLDGPNNGDSAPDKPEIVEGEGVNGSRCFKVTAFDNPTETWHTQFYIKADEVMPKGTKWQLKMSIKATETAMITSSAQAQPRQWKGDMGLGEIGVSTEWKDYKWSGEIGVDDFQSIAFDLSNASGTPGNVGVSFYFDNIEFGTDLGGSNPLSAVNVTACSDVVRIDFGGTTNMKELVKAAPTKTLIYDNSAVAITVDGEPIDIVSVEGSEDGNLYIFVDYEFYSGEEMKVAFKNPEDAAHRLLFTAGKWEGEAVPEISGLVASYDENLGEEGHSSYLYGEPALQEIVPEQGSFNLPVDFKEFTVTFNQPVLVSSVVAKLGSEELTATGDDEYSKVIKLTRTSETTLSGAKDLVISAAVGHAGADFGLAKDIVVKYSFGPVDASAKAETIYASNFTGDGTDANGAGWKVTADNQAGMQDASSGSGNRLQHGQSGYAADVLYLAQRSAAAGIALYGTVDDHKLTLEGGKTYHLTLKSAQWDSYPASGSNRSLRAQILTEAAVDAETGSVIDETGILAEEFKAVDGRVKEDKEFTSFDIEFTPEADGNFVIRLVAGNSEGNPAGYGDGNAIADVKVQFIPDVLGIVETQQLADALQSAKDNRDAILTANAENEIDKERYSGEDLTALSNLIADIEANMSGYTAPSVYVAKSEELAAAAKAANDHKTACDNYDTNIKKAVDHVAKNAENKFKETQVNKNLEAIVAKYHASKEVKNVATEEEDPVYVTTYTFDVLKDNDALATSSNELAKAVAVADQYFTEVALDANIQQGNSGVAVLVERNRLGARTLMSLGVEESDPLIAAVKNSVVDDDDLAENIKARIKTELYSKLKETENDVFGPQVDEAGDPVIDDNGEFVNKSYDMTVFIKNPNIYEVDGTKGLSEENIPGWTYPAQYGKPGDFKKWDPQRNVEGLPEDCAFTTWFGTCRMEQTVTDLPAGIYVVSLCGSDWSNQAGQSDESKRHDVNSFVYCKTSDTAPVNEGEEEDRDLNFAATRTIVYGGQYNMDHPINLGYAEVADEETGFISTEDGEFFGIPVVDGKLTLGMHFAGDGQFFFQHARLTLVDAAKGFDYAGAYNTVVTSIDETVAPKVRALQVYDLNGRRMIKANKGLQIVKKQMSDGSVRVEKVIVK
ncbi:hypothetical protein SAMN04487901_10210 [Prevotella communis]|uniref:Uncharacterized protein n=1 Tax=Prevotella communis TaxID=2913614 RepID=A0A1G7SVN8_9BACT|nr:hypothetical protein [Prevotella communis]SDG26844.1 hypothetical protein SAMN04487901_10210 [Prevotella communis]